MHIDLSAIDRTQFNVQPHVIAGETCHLITPFHVAPVWTPDNLHLRSSLWDSAGNLISASYKKHFNWDERPDLDPAPADLTGVELMEKMDGSTLIVSPYKDQVITRTRGTVDATKLDNGDEIAVLKARYPLAFIKLSNVPDCDFLYEWVSPRNTIVIPYAEPDIYLTGIISRGDYSYWSQDMLDWVAGEIGVKRPRRYRFNTLSEMLVAVTAFKGVEGVCAYYNGGQSWRKHKAADYLVKHRFKERATLPNTLDLWFAQGKPDVPTFKANLIITFDHECLSMITIYIDEIAAAYMAVQFNLIDVSSHVQDWKALPRRDAALLIKEHYEHRGLCAAAFQLLSDRQPDDRIIRKLMEARLGL